MAGLIEQARTALQFHQLIGSDYRVTVEQAIHEQRTQERVPADIEEPFERLFIFDAEASSLGHGVFRIPCVSLYEPSDFELHFKFRDFSGISWATRPVTLLQITDKISGSTFDLAEGVKEVGFDKRNDQFSANPFSEHMVIGIPDSFAALYALGHEKTHIQDARFQDVETQALLASAYTKVMILQLTRGNKGIPFIRTDIREYVKNNLDFLAGTYLSKARRGRDALLNEPVSPEEAYILLAVEEFAAEGGLNYLSKILDFVRFESSEQERIMMGAQEYALDGLTTYVDFADTQVGKGFNDWLTEVKQ